MSRHTFIRQVLYIQHSDLDSLLSQELNDNLSNTITSARHNDDLAVPVVLVAGPIVGDPVAQPRTSRVE